MKHHVLIVDDDPMLRRGMVALIRAAGHDATGAGTLAEGMDLLAAGPSHVLLDATLPDGVGTTILRHVRAAGLPIKVAILSGWGNDALLLAGDAQPDALFTKPPNWNAVVDWVAS